MVGSNGNFRVVGFADMLKHEKITDNNCNSILLLRVVSSAWADVYMTNGVKVNLETLRGDLAKEHNAITGSGIYATPNAYIND